MPGGPDGHDSPQGQRAQSRGSDPSDVLHVSETRRSLGPQEGGPHPSQPGCPHYSLNLYPDFRPERSKMGLSDENILLDSRQVPWLGEVLQHLSGLHSGPMLPDADVYALTQIGLRANHCVPYQLRHSGPSHDLLIKARTTLEVKLRGRWASDASVKRYEAHARVGQEFQALPQRVQKAAVSAADSFNRVAPKFFGVRIPTRLG